MSEITQKEVDAIADTLGEKLQRAIEDAGLKGYELESIDLKPKADATVMGGLLPSCHLECSVGGFPPKVKCSVKCG